MLHGMLTASSSKKLTIFSNTNACIIVDGISPVKDETEEQITAKTKNFLIKNLGFEERKVNEELDKCHRLGKAKDGKQSTIIWFKSHSF